MRKVFILMAAAVIALTGCGKEIEQQEKRPAPVDEMTTGEETTAAEDKEATPEEEEEPEVVEERDESSEAETEKKKADPDKIDVAFMDTVEVYQQISLGEFVFDSNAELLNGEELLDTEELGEHEVTLKLELDGGEAEKKVTYSVVDTTPPVMLLASDCTIGTGTSFDPGNYISYADNYDRAPKLSWEGTVDTSEEGTYYVTLYVTDSSGNKLTWGMNVRVSDDSSGSSGAYGYDDAVINFSDFKDGYAAPNRELGIDVSHWQGDIDFGQVAAAGCDFVMIRMGYGSGGGEELDSHYYDNIADASAAGLDVGVYFYSYDTTKEGARATAKRIVEVLDGRKLDLPVAFDWEEFYSFQDRGMSIHDLCEVFEAFSEELEKSGYDVMLYGSKIFLENFWENRCNRPVWLAHYVSDTSYSGEWSMWQRGCTGRIAGINGAVDLNILKK